jgi:hypothetical protein
MLSRQRELRRAVVERGWYPSIGRVTRFAAMVEDSDDMVRIRRLLIVSLVAREAISVLQSVVVVDVAKLTLRRDVLSGQCKIRGVVVEGGRLPARRVVTLRAHLGISQRLMVWIPRICVLRAVTINTV